jgi:hypothetical protein
MVLKLMHESMHGWKKDYKLSSLLLFQTIYKVSKCVILLTMKVSGIGPFYMAGYQHIYNIK